MAYAHTTLAQAKSQLAALLHDPGNVYWTDAELGIYLTEALRTWGAYAFYWKDRGQFVTTAGTAFYALQAMLPTLLGFTVTDTDLTSAVKSHLLESATLATFTEQFTLQEVTDALQRRRNQFLVETGCVLTHGSTFVAAPPDGRVELADTVIDVRRCAWLTADGYYIMVHRNDEWGFSSYDRAWPQTLSIPDVYSTSAGPPLFVQLYPIPADLGTLDHITVDTGANLNPIAGIVLGVPDDYSWVIKWGALSDLLGKDGQARDPQRAQYCDARWRQGCELARIGTSVVQARWNDRTLPVASLEDFDHYDHSLWQSKTGRPEGLPMASPNLAAVYKVPDAVYSITVDVVRKAPVPVNDADQIQVGREEMEAIISYAQHLACFKMGGAEFEMTYAHLERFMKLAMVRNERLKAAAINYEALMDRGRLQEETDPRREQVTA